MEGQYSIKQVVWAKVDPYPWWPGKIVKILQQNKKTVYKVSFFADPTYTFLHQSQLIPYHSYDHSANQPQQHLPQLQKAIQTAKLYHAKLNSKTQEEALDIQVTPLTDFSQQQKREENVTQNIIIPEERKEEPEQNTIQIEQSNQEAFNADQITVQNVLEMIEKNRKRQKICGYSYQNRKEEMQIEGELKRTLLMKYNLYDCGNQKQNKEQEGSYKKQIIQITHQKAANKQLKRICKQKSKTKVLLHGEIEILRAKCLRKITSILTNSQENIETTKIQAVKIMKRILILSENNRMKLQSLFITLIKALSSSSPLLKCEQKLAEFNNYLQQLQNDKHEDDGSKITQIQGIN